MASYNNKTEGFLLVDVLVGLVIATIISAALIGTVVAAVRYASGYSRTLQAEFLATELIEVSRDLESSNWAALADGLCTVDAPCHPSVLGSDWELVADPEIISGFTRSLYVEEVTRNASTFALDDAGDPDDTTKKVIATVSWYAHGEPRELVLETYVYNNS